MCKCGDAFSLRVLIGRGLDLLRPFLFKIILSLVFIRFSGFYLIVGVDYDEDPPVPIPNTVVKLVCAENTWRAASRENRSMPTQRSSPRAALLSYSSLAQLAEHAVVNRRVVGSSPTGGANNRVLVIRYPVIFNNGPLAQLVRATGS